MANPSPPPLPAAPTPTTLSLIIATAIIAGLGGYFLGQASSLGVFSSSSSRNAGSAPRTRKQVAGKKSRDGVGSSDESSGGEVEETSGEEGKSEEGEEEQQQGGLKTFADDKDDCKMCLVVRMDLGMGKGKIAAQTAHAALANYTTLLQSSSLSPSHPLLTRWARTGQAKICLQVADAAGLEDVRRRAAEAGLAAGVIHDAGRTQIAAGSATVVAVGPGPRGVVDGVTGGLRLL